MIFEVKNARKSFGQNEVLKDISLGIDKGEVVAIIGPSGSGKSTLLRCSTFLDRFDGGSLCYNDDYAATMDENGNSVYVPAKERFRFYKYYGLVFQNFNLFPHYSILKNVIDPMIAVDKVKKSEAKERGMKLLEMMGLSDKADTYPCRLSGGQQQRVAIARALSLNPEILFFDEPTSALDPELTGEILSVIKDLAKTKMTMIIVTHEMKFARDVADRIIFMDGGLIVEEGNAKSLINSPQNERTIQFLAGYNN